MGTSGEVTPIAQPHFGRHRLASYISNGVHSAVVYQCFEAIVKLFSLHYLYAAGLWLSVIHIGFIKLELCHGWKWYVGSWGRETIARLNYCYSVYSFAGTCLAEGKGQPALA